MLYFVFFIFGIIVGVISTIIQLRINQRKKCVGTLIFYRTEDQGDVLGFKLGNNPSALLINQYVTMKVERSQE